MKTKKHKEPRFYVLFSYIGFYPEHDKIIGKTIKREAQETGYNFISGRRELFFYYYYEQSAKNALKKLKKLKKYNATVELVKCAE